MNLEIISESTSPQARGLRLKTIRNMAGFTIHGFAKKYGIGSSTIKYWERGRGKGLSIKGVEKIIAATRSEGVYAAAAWLMHGIGDRPRIVDMQQSIPAQQAKINTASEEKTAIANEVNMFRNNNINAVTLVISDDGMGTVFSIGDIVGGNRLTGLDIDKALGKNCIVETEDKKILCRKLMRKSNSDSFVLCSLNPQTTINPANLWDVKIISAAPISRIWTRH